MVNYSDFMAALGIFFLSFYHLTEGEVYSGTRQSRELGEFVHFSSLTISS